MRKLMLAAFYCSLSTLVYAGAAMVGSETFDTDTKQVSVSTDCSKPTQIMRTTSYISHNVVVNISTWTYLYLSTASTNAAGSNATLFYVPTNSSFSPDGPQDAYNGPMYACSSATVTGVQATSQTVGVIRLR